MADDFAEEYEGKVEDFIEFISQEDLIAPGTFKQTWRFIEKEKHSLERFTNMHLIFKWFNVASFLRIFCEITRKKTRKKIRMHGLINLHYQ